MPTLWGIPEHRGQSLSVPGFSGPTEARFRWLSLQIPSQCLTCIRFRALREHVVGRTSALPISVYDYYEPGKPAPTARNPNLVSTLSPIPCHPLFSPHPAAFEATRFYNVSAHSPLAWELCAGPACNEVERALAQGPGECAESLLLPATCHPDLTRRPRGG